ncbi:MAG: hypothetical protein AAFO95_21825, partial [Cyanobacteria bacterium J06600_6]
MNTRQNLQKELDHHYCERDTLPVSNHSALAEKPLPHDALNDPSETTDTPVEILGYQSTQDAIIIIIIIITIDNNNNNNNDNIIAIIRSLSFG